MTPLAFLVVLMSVIPFASGYFQTVTTAEPLTVTKKVIALENFLAYRGAVLMYAENNPAYIGSVADDSLPGLPPGYQKMGPWTNQLTTTQIIAYGSSDIGMIGASTLTNDSTVYSANYLIGYAKSGNWVTTAGGVITTAPAFVPEGAILAIINK